MYGTYDICNLEAIIRKRTFGFVGRLYKSCNTIYKVLKMHGLLEYSYGILCIKCSTQTGDVFDGTIFL